LGLLDGGERVGSETAVRLLRGVGWEALSNNFPSLGGGLVVEDQDLHLQFFHQGHHSMEYHRLSNFVPSLSCFVVYRIFLTIGFHIEYCLIIMSEFLVIDCEFLGSFTKNFSPRNTYPERD
jgi:hypothetical protein